MPVGRAPVLSQRPGSRESLTLSVIVDDYKQAGEVTPDQKSSRAGNHSEPESAVADLLLRSVNSHGIEPTLNTTTLTGSYQSFRNYKDSPDPLLTSNGGSIPSQPATPTYMPIPSPVTSLTPPSREGAPDPGPSPFDHNRLSTAYTEVATGLASPSSLRAYATPPASDTNPSASVTSLSPSQRGSMWEELHADSDSLCMPLPPGSGQRVADRSQKLYPTQPPPVANVPRPSPTRTSPNAGAAANAAAAAASQWHTRPSSSSGAVRKDHRARSQEVLPRRPGAAGLQSSNGQHSDSNTTTEAYLASAGMPSVLPPSESHFPRVPAYHRNTGVAATLMTATTNGNYPHTRASPVSQSTNAYAKAQLISQHASTSGAVSMPTHTTAPSSSSTSAAHRDKGEPGMSSDDISDRPSSSAEQRPTIIDVGGIPEVHKPAQLRGGRHAYVSNPVSPPAVASAPAEDTDNSVSTLLAPLDARILDDAVVPEALPAAHPTVNAARPHAMARVANSRVQQYLSLNKAPAARGSSVGGPSSHKFPSSDMEGTVPRQAAPAHAAAISPVSSTAASMQNVAKNSDMQWDRRLPHHGAKEWVPETQAAIKSFPVATGRISPEASAHTMHAAAATKAEISPASQQDVGHNVQEGAVQPGCSGRHMHARRMEKLHAQSGSDAEHGTTPDSGHRQIDQALQHLEAPSSVSPQRASRSANLHNAQHALHRTLTPPQSLERKSSVNSNHQNHAPMEACTMDALAAQHSGSMMSAHKMQQATSITGGSHRSGLPPSGAYVAHAPKSRTRQDHTHAYATGQQPSSQNGNAPEEQFNSVHSTLTRANLDGMDTGESHKYTTRSQRLHVPRPKASDNHVSGNRIPPHMLNAAFSSAPHITLDMITKGQLGYKPEESLMSDAILDSVMTTNTSIGGLLNQNVDHCESARLEKAHPFRETMDSITSQRRAPRLGGNELFNSHLDSLREALALPSRSRAPSSVNGQSAAVTTGADSSAPLLGAAAPAAKASVTAPVLWEEPTAQSSTGPMRAAAVPVVSRSERDYREHHGDKVRSRHPTPPHDVLHSSIKGSKPRANPVVHIQPQPAARRTSKPEPHRHSQSQASTSQQNRHHHQPSHRLDKEKSSSSSQQRKTQSRTSRRLPWPKRSLQALPLQPSAMSLLHAGLAKGVHEGVIVLPVHIYLPPVKLTRGSPKIERTRRPQRQASPPHQPERPPHQEVSMRSLDGQASHALSSPTTFPAGNHSPITPTQELGDTQPIKERSQWLDPPTRHSIQNSSASVRPMPHRGASAEPRSRTQDTALRRSSMQPGLRSSTKQTGHLRSKLHNSQLQSTGVRRSMMTGAFAQSMMTCFAPARTLEDASDHDSCCSDIEQAGTLAAADIQADVTNATSSYAFQKPKNESRGRGWRNMFRKAGASRTRASHMQSQDSTAMRTGDPMRTNDSKVGGDTSAQDTRRVQGNGRAFRFGMRMSLL